MRQCPRIHSFHCSGEKPDAEETQKTVSQLRFQSPVAGLRRRIVRSKRSTVLMSFFHGLHFSARANEAWITAARRTTA